MGIPALFEVKSGININNANMLSGEGIPGGAGGYPDDAGRGSIYLDTTNGSFYLKKTTGTGTDKWTRVQNKDDMDAAMVGLSWRDPALLYDTTAYADLAAAETAVNAGTIDGVAVADTNRILFTNITGSNQNVFIITGTPGSGAILVEDANTASKGDALYVQDGTAAGKQYSYNGTVWVQQGASSATEIAFLQAFMGKSGDGNELPNYPSNSVVTDGDSLEKAIGDLDGEVGSAVSGAAGRTVGTISDQAINRNIEALDDAIGPDVTSTNVATVAAAVNANISALDGEIGSAVSGAATRTVGLISDQAINRNVEALDDAIGNDVTSTKIVATSNSVNANISLLDEVLAEARTEVGASNVTTAVTLDSVLVDEVLAAEWTVHARSVATPSKTWCAKILASHNGAGTADATLEKHNLFAALQTGAAINQLEFDVDLNDTGAAQVMRLRVSSSEAADIRVTRSVVAKA